ncbi:hypothetical protein AKO1_002810 [Acrasis kona]|uniref:Uncharacterized protein n=1 Tax=Acrasis kona TaxID=1008807 RepID=A0AAW2ZPB9_9EUKA
MGYNTERFNKIQNPIESTIITGIVFDEISENKCRFTECCYINMNMFGIFNSTTFVHRMFKVRAESHRKVIKKALSANQEENIYTRTTASILNDYIHKYIPTEESQPESSFEPRIIL